MSAALSLLLIASTVATSPAFAGDTLKILMISPEQAPILQTGGLAHATTGLARALREEGVKIDVLMPFYYEMAPPTEPVFLGPVFDVALDGIEGRPTKRSRFSLHESRTQGDRTLFLKHESANGELNYFDNRRNGATRKFYAPSHIEGEAFGALAKAQADLILSSDYDLVILNDWSAGLVALHLHEAKRAGRRVPKVVFAVHNLAYQGRFAGSLHRFLRLPDWAFSPDGAEYYGDLSFMKAGLQYSDLTYTVSETYANEITTPRFGQGLEGVMQRLRHENRLTGVLNGINPSEWDPRRLAIPFTAANLEGKARGKQALQAELGLPQDSTVPLVVLTSRLTEQKGFHYLFDALADLARARQVQIVFVADGEDAFVQRARDLEREFPSEVRYRPFSTALEHRATAYGDIFVNASWFEPSGLNQFFAMALGTVPVVTKVGGLASSVREEETGFLIDVAGDANSPWTDNLRTRQNVVATLKRALDTYERNPAAFLRLQLNGLSQDNSWRNRVRAEVLPMLDYVVADGPIRLAQQNIAARERVQSPSQLAQSAGIPPRFRAPVRAGTCKLVFGP